jgi:hypothetical protein
MSESSAVCPESTLESSNRRNFIKKAAIATAIVGASGTLLAKIPESTADSFLPKKKTDRASTSGGPETTFCCITVYGDSCLYGCVYSGPIYSSSVSACSLYSTAVYGSSIAQNCVGGGCGTGVRGSSTFGTGVFGCSSLDYCSCYCPCPFGGSGIGVHGSSVSGIAIKGNSCNPVTGVFSNNGKSAKKTASIQIQNGCSTPVSWNAAVGGAGEPHGVTNGQFFLGHCGPKLVLNKCGKVGIGTTNPNATLQVNGGVSVGTKIEASNYNMSSSDFAILVNAGAKALTITLPPASNTGQMVHVKKIDSSSNHVTISRHGSDTIEGSSSKSLSSQYGSLTLIAGGNGIWYILSSAT